MWQLEFPALVIIATIDTYYMQYKSHKVFWHVPHLKIDIPYVMYHNELV